MTLGKTPLKLFFPGTMSIHYDYNRVQLGVGDDAPTFSDIYLLVIHLLVSEPMCLGDNFIFFLESDSGKQVDEDR